MSNNNLTNTIIPFPEPPRVNLENPWSDDAFDREAVSTRLTETVSKIGREGRKSGLVIVSGDYGVGKSFFLKRWVAEWAKEGTAIEHNMWECEDDDDPLVGLVCSLLEAAKSASADEPSEDTLSRLKTEVLRYTQPTLSALSVATQDLAKKFLGIDAQALMDEWMGKADPMSRWHVKRKARDAIKTLLSDIVNGSEGGPLVVVIDELDRCRPIFAVETLKRLNHVLDIPRVVFVVGVNMSALEASVRSVYGDNSPREYLLPMCIARLNLRPLSFRPFDIPAGDAGAISEKLKDYIEVKLRQHALQRSESYKENLLHIFAGLVHGPHPITPRHIDSIFQWVSLALVNTSQIILEPLMLVPLAAMRVVSPNDYMKIAAAPENFAMALDALDTLFPDEMPEGFQYDITPKWEIMAYFALASRDGRLGSSTENNLFNLLHFYANGGLEEQRKSLLPRCLSDENRIGAVQQIVECMDEIERKTKIQGYEVRYGTMLTIISAFDLRPGR